MKIKPVKRAVAIHVSADGITFCDSEVHYVEITLDCEEVWFPNGGWWPLSDFHVFEYGQREIRGKTAFEREVREQIMCQLTADMTQRAEKLGFVLVLVSKTIMPRGKRIARFMGKG
jgi:hypothetical protein